MFWIVTKRDKLQEKLYRFERKTREVRQKCFFKKRVSRVNSDYIGKTKDLRLSGPVRGFSVCDAGNAFYPRRKLEPLPHFVYRAVELRMAFRFHPLQQR